MNAPIETRQENGRAEMTFLEHLEELRRTLVRMAVVTLLAMVVCLSFTSTLLALLRRPVEHVWLEHERSHLPAGVSAQDWVAAKELQSARMGLSAELRENLQKRFSPTVLALADAVDFLRAASTLPHDQQASFLQQMGDAESQRLARALHAANADLHVGQSSNEPRMMGAFQPGEAFLLSVQLAFFGYFSESSSFVSRVAFYFAGTAGAGKTRALPQFGLGCGSIFVRLRICLLGRAPTRACVFLRVLVGFGD